MDTILDFDIVEDKMQGIIKVVAAAMLCEICITRGWRV